MTTDFFLRFRLPRNYKVQIAAHVGRKSAVVPSGRSEASYRHFFIGQVLGSSRSSFQCLSTSFKNYHSEASKRLKSRRIELSSKSSALLMKRFPWRTSSEKKTGGHVKISRVKSSDHPRILLGRFYRFLPLIGRLRGPWEST